MLSDALERKPEGQSLGSLWTPAGDMSGNLSATIPCAAYSQISVQLTAPSDTHVGTFSFLFSMDGILANATAVTLSVPITASNGSVLNAWADLDVFGPYLHVVYTAGSGAGALSGKAYGKAI